MVLAIVTNEPVSASYTDQEIADILASCGHRIHRTTVRHHRNTLGILESRERDRLMQCLS